MAYILNIKNKAIKLRKHGYSLQEISEFLKVSKGTLSLWLKNIKIDPWGRKRLAQRMIRVQALNAFHRKKHTRNLIAGYQKDYEKIVGSIQLSQDIKKLLCAIIYWCEGVKDVYSGLRFTNSDPQLVKIFLNLFRSSFKLNESKFRVCVHLHSYHDQEVEQKFWSKVTDIPRKQFTLNQAIFLKLFG